MAKKYRNLIQRIADPANIAAAHDITARGRRGSQAYLVFKEYALLSLDALREELATGRYVPDPVRLFTVYEPKPRLITTQSFRDRVAQHALVNVIGPIFEAGLLPRTFACRKNMGTHAGVRALQAAMRRMHATGRPVYFLKTDFSKYFPSVQRAVLHAMIRRKISCAATLRLIEAMVPPDGTGLPIGSLTSQLFANVYASPVDRFLQNDPRTEEWFRYMDDIVVLGYDCAALHGLKKDMEALAGSMLGLRLSKWSVAPVSRGVNFLGYRIWPGYKLLRKASVKRARQRLKELAAHGRDDDGMRFVAAWQGHVLSANTFHLRRSLRLVSEGEYDVRWGAPDDDGALVVAGHHGDRLRPDPRWWV